MCGWEDSIKLDIGEIKYEDGDLIELAEIEPSERFL
jgi:hypothetical protein